MPWPGYDKGQIVCKACNYASPDDLARKGRVQKCDLCSKIVYIPSGLHSPYYEPNVTRRQNGQKSAVPGFIVNGLDFLAATFTKFIRSKAKWPILIILVLAIVGFVVGGMILKNKSEVKAEIPTPAKTYYLQILPLRGNVSQSIENFRIIAGDVPGKANFSNWRNPNNRERFIRACDETLKSIVGTIDQVRALKDTGAVPAEAQSHQAKMLEMLYARQMYYARLKDGINNNDQKTWNSAFDLKDTMSTTFSDENGALETLRDLVLNSKNAGK